MNPNPSSPADGLPQASPPVPAPAPVALTAAQEAADFVARIFADAPQAAAAPEGVVVEPTPAPAALPPPPTDWPARASHPLQGQRVLVLGLGASGLAMARWCVRCGAQVSVADTRSAPPQLAQMQAELPSVQFVSGPLDAALLYAQAPQWVLRSPGLQPAKIAPLLEAARACQIRVKAELDLYSEALELLHQQHGYAPRVLAVTGTNGKTTVTSLTAHLLDYAGIDAVKAGNIGPTLLDTLAQRLQAGALPQAWVLELSSFQLDGVQGFAPTAATVLNVTQDHLDWHGSMAAYAAAKACIFGPQTLRVLNRDDPQVMAWRPAPEVEPSGKGRARAAKAAPLPPHCSFGLQPPQHPGDWGLETVNGLAWLVRALEEEDHGQPRSRRAPQQELHIQRLMPADALRIRGRHNSSNALAALALALAGGASLASMLYGLREYRGEPHRVESIGMVDEVEYFDDSKGTNVGATVAALGGLGAERRLVVILGGDGKGQDFSPLAEPIAQTARAVVLIGRDAPLLRQALQGSGVPLLDAADMPHAVTLAAQHAQAGDAVLMSPACASLDMFRDYAHRAAVFIDAVQALAHERGQSLEGG